MSRRPFIVYALPRSRTAWTAALLSRGERSCGHDLGVESDTLEDFAAALRTRCCGTVETGAVIAWRALRTVLPEAVIAVIRRPVAEVYASLSALGFGSAALMAMLRERSAMLDEVERQPGVLSVRFSELSRFDECRRLYEHCLDEPLDWEWWESLAERNIQIDVHAAMHRLAERRSAIERLKAEAATLTDGTLTIGLEHWTDVWPEIDALFAEHFEETDGGVEPNRRYELHEPVMRAMNASGQSPITTARIGGCLIGYCMWTITSDVESKGLLIASQGPWFVRPGYERFRAGAKLFDASVADLKRRGVKVIYPHHRVQGRGAKLGAFFRRRGAKEIQRTYSMWIGD